MPDLNIRNNLLLDELNPRFGEIQGQSNILKFFSKDRKTQNLARDIAKMGLSPMDRIVVMPKGKRNVVLEGNRRVAAIKLMHAPEAAAGDKESAVFKKAAQLGDQIPDFADCYVVRDRTEARPWISRKHNGEMKGVGTVDWDSLEQERFLAQNGETGRYAHLLTMIDEILQYQSADLPSGSLAVIDRLLNSAPFQKAFRVKPLSDGEFEREVDDEILRRFFDTVISDYSAEIINTRKLNEESQQRSYVESVIKKEFSGEIEFETQKTRTESPAKKAKKAPTSRRGRQPNVVLISRDWKNPSSHQRVVDVVGELQRLAYRSYPTAAAGALRALLEISSLHYREVVMGQRPQRQNKLPDVLKQVARHAENHQALSDSQCQMVIKVATDANTPVGLDALNGALHNPNYTIDYNALNRLWHDVEPFIRLILQASENAKK